MNTGTNTGEGPSRQKLSRAGIALLVLALALGIVAWRLVGDELFRARINTSAAFSAWLASDKPLADIAFDRGPQLGSFILAQEEGEAPRIVDRDNTEGLSSREQTKYIVWRLSGAGYDLLYCTTGGMQANPARVSRRYSELGPEIAAQFAPDDPDIPVLFAEPIRNPWLVGAIAGVPILLLLAALYLFIKQAAGSAR